MVLLWFLCEILIGGVFLCAASSDPLCEHILASMLPSGSHSPIVVLARVLFLGVCCVFEHSINIIRRLSSVNGTTYFFVRLSVGLVVFLFSFLTSEILCFAVDVRNFGRKFCKALNIFGYLCACHKNLTSRCVQCACEQHIM